MVWACKPPGTEAVTDDADAGQTVAAVPVDVVTVHSGDVRRTVRASTTLEAETVAVSARTSGVLAAQRPDIGDLVEAGSQIALIADPQQQVVLDGAYEQLGRLRDEADRMRPLVEQGYLPRIQLEQVESSAADVQNLVDRTRAQIGELTVNSPITGVVVERSLVLGELVIPNQPIFEIADLNTLVAPTLVPERELAWLRFGQVATLVVDALAGREVSATVQRIDPTVDAQTGTVRVELAVDPAAIAGGDLRPGMFVRAAIEVERREAVAVIPKRAIVYEADTAWVFRIAGEGEGSGGEPTFTIERVRIETGFEDDDMIEVRDGLDIGDRIIVAGQSALDDDSEVRIVPGVAGDGSGEGSAGAP
jgi:membrane fusion protein (multidrug efflux system)